MRDLYNNLNVVQTVDPVVATADVNGAGVDRQGYDSVLHIVNVGESGDTLSGSVYMDLILQDSPDNSTWTDVTDANYINGAFTDSANGIFATIDDAAEDDAVHKIGYRGPERYSRVVYDITGTHTNGTPMSMTAIRGNAQDNKVS